MQLAESRGVSVINSPYDTATTTMRIKAARRIDEVVQRDFVSLSPKMPIAAAQQHVFRSPQASFPVIEDGKLFGVLSKSDLVTPPQHEVVLVDHNEIAQAVAGAEGANIIEVIDHHRLGGSLRSSHPIHFQMEPVGSTCTLIAKKFHQAGIKPSSGIALCMASGMISDTLVLAITNGDRRRQEDA